jgi:hypothetical protein
MNTREITLIQSTIDHGHIIFAGTDQAFFPEDALGDPGRSGKTGSNVTFHAGDFLIESDIRVKSRFRLSPRTTFMPYLKSVGARAGDVLRIKRVAERKYLVEHVRM